MDQCITLRGFITFIRWRGEENFKIARFMTDANEDIWIKGSLPEATEEESMEITGEWIDDKKYGRQFQVMRAYILLPSSLSGKEKYLSNRLEGVGPTTASLLVKHFGHQIYEILDFHPERLLEIEGIGKKTADRIAASWKAQNDPVLKAVGMFLAQHGIGDGWAERFIRCFGANTVSILEANPYKSMKVVGVAFKKADDFARRMGWPEKCPERTEAAFTHVLQESITNGHVYLNHDELVTAVQKVASSFSGKKHTLMPKEDVLTALYQVVLRKELIRELVTVDKTLRTIYYIKNMYEAEKRLAKRIGELQTYMQEPPRGIEQTLDRVEQDLGQVLEAEQSSAVLKALTNNISVITGRPGTGKTTVTKALIRTAKRLGIQVVCCAPTGRAAKRMSEVTGEPAQTIHRLLMVNPETGKFAHNADFPIEGGLLLIDESSMLELEIMDALLDAVPDHMSVVAIGDVDQLPSVGPGMVLRDLIQSNRVCVTRLERIFRQAEGSLIIRNAHNMARGEMLRFPEQKGIDVDSYLIEIPRCDNEQGEEVADIGYVKKMLPLLAKRLQERQAKKGLVMNPIRDIQVLCPMRIGPAGSNEFNKVLQESLNPDSEGMQFKSQMFRIGDRVMQLENNYEDDMLVFNGDIGFVKGFDEINRELIVTTDGRDVRYDYNATDQLTLAYACTVHKAQGSEFDFVIIVVTGHHSRMLERNLLYTANSRAKKVAVYIAEKWAIRKAVNTNNVNKRNSLLSTRIRQELPRELIPEMATTPFDLPIAASV